VRLETWPAWLFFSALTAALGSLARPFASTEDFLWSEGKFPGTFVSAPKVPWPFLQGDPHVSKFSIPEYFHIDGLPWFALPQVPDQVIGIFNLQLINPSDYISTRLE
jgi:hypothetical protein